MALTLIAKIRRLCSLRLPDSYDAKIAKIWNLWTFWSVIQSRNHLFKIPQKAFLPNAP